MKLTNRDARVIAMCTLPTNELHEAINELTSNHNLSIDGIPDHDSVDNIIKTMQHNQEISMLIGVSIGKPFKII